MNKIPILFDHEGQAFKGSFDEVQGSGKSKTWHLMINNFYYGKLCLRFRLDFRAYTSKSING